MWSLWKLLFHWSREVCSDRARGVLDASGWLGCGSEHAWNYIRSHESHEWRVQAPQQKSVIFQLLKPHLSACQEASSQQSSPSQVGLGRRSRAESVTAISPVRPGKHSHSFRVRASSDGEGNMSRPASVDGSPSSPSTARPQSQRHPGWILQTSPATQSQQINPHAHLAMLPLSHQPRQPVFQQHQRPRIHIWPASFHAALAALAPPYLDRQVTVDSSPRMNTDPAPVTFGAPSVVWLQTHLATRHLQERRR